MIHKTIRLPCSPERAFELLTKEAGAWWPPDRRHTTDRASAIRIEAPTASAEGRFFERASDGTEVELGRVREMSPPHRLVLDWYPGTGPELPTSVEIELSEEDGGTRVRLRHGPGPRSAEAYAKKAPAYDRSWELVLAAWAAAAA
jgi:uncharacterized protein YndB with AHSA1/START domain